jgi:hypothetical protein
MQDSLDDRAGDVPASEDAIDGSGPHADGGHEGAVDDVAWRIASIRRLLGQTAFMLDSPPGVRRR